MKKLATFASDFRLNALLCCSAAVLLTACGGGMTDSAQQSQTAASVTSSADQSAANVAATTPNAADAASAQAGEAAAANFEMSGYDSTPASTGATEAQAPADGAPRLLASISASAPTVSAVTTTPATTYNYYVSPTGSDTAAGTKAAPFKTLARAAKAATKPSTTVWVAPGTYAGGIKTTANGTASGRIYWVSTTKWGAKIVPPSSSSNNNAWDNRGNYVSIIGFDVDGTNSGSGTKWTHG
ncbi:DUF1565 domain-containing protein, partial [Massilia norwichensis]